MGANERLLREQVRVEQYQTSELESREKEREGRELVTQFLRHIGEDPMREGLLETPSRVVRSWKELYGGYFQNPEQALKVQFNESYDEMVILKDIEFYSTCEHHLQPFFGFTHVAYLPGEQVVGLSKLARLVEVYARRLQIQERFTTEIADSLMEYLAPKGCGVVVEAKHFCMICRGVSKQNSTMTTSAIRGLFLEPGVREEFHRLMNRK